MLTNTRTHTLDASLIDDRELEGALAALEQACTRAAHELAVASLAQEFEIRMRFETVSACRRAVLDALGR